IIGPETLTNHIPLSTSKDKETGKDILVSQYEGGLIEQVGMLKMDFLGLTTLSILRTAVENIKENHGVDIDVNALPLTDIPTYQLFSRGDTAGIFQFESDGMRKWLKELKPTCVEDLIAMTALYRPGPMDYIPDFIDRKHGRKEITYDLPQMEKFLKETYGITVYQEQVMLLSQELAGFSGFKADSLRRAMGKKRPEEMEELRKDFLKDGSERGIDEDVLKKIWVDWTAFSQYAFNKSHAASYSMLSYQTAYLKANYPADFMAALLTRVRDNIADVSKYMDECVRMGLNVLGPDINESMHDFTVNKTGDIRFGMAGIKGVGYGAVEDIVQERKSGGPFRNIYDFIERINLNSCNKKVLESLVYAGAFDSFPDIKREQYFLPCGKDGNFLESLICYGDRMMADKNKGMNSLFGDGADSMVAIEKPMPATTILEVQEDFLKREKEMVGIYLSSHPLDAYKFEMNHFTSHTLEQATHLYEESQLAKEFNPQTMRVGGIVTQVTSALAKSSGRPWGTFTLEDYTSTLRFTLFGKDYEQFLPYMRENEILLVRCSLQERFQRTFRNRGAAADRNPVTSPGPVPKEFKVLNISLLANAKDTLNALTIYLNVEEITEAFRKELVHVISKNPGKIALHIDIKDKNENMAVKVFSRSYKIDLTQDLLGWIDKKAIDFSVE
ncbi:MAG: DNA polymerase III subunit alpha, partial [Bacteroidales bacterium]|nr:DNA polymerase III subunit alpha [Bacteroidales bacterium]